MREVDARLLAESDRVAEKSRKGGTTTLHRLRAVARQLLSGHTNLEIPLQDALCERNRLRRNIHGRRQFVLRHVLYDGYYQITVIVGQAKQGERVGGGEVPYAVRNFRKKSAR